MGNKDSRQLFQSILRAFARFAIIFVVLFASVYYHGSTKVYALSDCPGGAGDITISANTSWAQGDYSCSSLTVNSGATLTIAGNTTIALTAAAGNGIYVTGNSTLITSGDITAGTGVTFTVASDVTIDTGSKISADAKGYGGTGPGSGPNGSWTGGGYGGMSTSGVTYGSAIAPVSLGSGAYNSVGGGAVKINIAGNLVNSGTITANGGVTSTNGGSGGSVWINFTGGASTWTGTSGIVTASGISYGAGGRVAVTEYVSDTRTGGSVLATGSNSSAGTVYTKSTAQSNGVLTIDNNTAISTTGKYAQTDIASLTLDSLIVKNKGAFNLPSGSTITIAASGSIGGTSDAAVNIASGGIIDASGAATLAGPAVTNNLGATFTTAATWTLALPLIQRGTLTQNTALTVASGGTLTADVAGDTFASILVQSGGNITHTADPFVETYKVDLVVTGNVTVDSGGTINVNGLGFDSVSGPGSGGNVVNGAGGYGGMGTNGVTYGSATAPVNIGSGAYSQFGGGAIKLSIGGNLSNSGTISSNGSQRLNLDGGGSGGSVWINFTGGASTWTGTSGVITANGGIPGAGGRVAITEYVSDTRTGGSVLAIGNWKSSAGTVYTKSTAQTNGTLTIDNNSVNASATKYAQTNAASLTLDSLIVKNKGAINLPTGTTITIAASGSISGTSDAAINIASGGILDSSGTATLSGPIVTNNLGGTLTTAATWSLATSLIQRGTLTQNTALTVASGGTLTADVAGDTFASILVQSGGNITHTANTNAETYKINLTITGNLTVNSGGTINTLEKGFGAGFGSGTGDRAGYGGEANSSTGGGTYGSTTAPESLGSGSTTRSGGGAIKINVGGDFSNSGVISSDGYSAVGGNSASGGSVWINLTGVASAWAGTSGQINAKGGWGAGGGRIAITGYVTDTHTGTQDAATTTAGGASGTIFTKSTSQTNGTLTIDAKAAVIVAGKYTKTNAASLTLDALSVINKAMFQIPSGTSITINSGGTITGNTNSYIYNADTLNVGAAVGAAGGGPVITNTGTIATPATWSLGTQIIQRGTITQSTALTIISGGILTADISGDTFSSVTIQSGGKINHSANVASETYKNVLNIGSLTINSGGSIDVAGLGYTGGSAGVKGNGTGFGGLGGSNSSGGGAGYGGVGGAGLGGSPGSAGTTYGSSTVPLNIGSGGGGGVSAAGGAGGGSVILNITSNFINAGTITANGAAGSSGNYGGGGGSGGTVSLNIGGNFDCTGGAVTANGGAGAGSPTKGGGGGGGRLLRSVSGTYTACTTFTVSGGTGGGNSGSDGTSSVPPAAPIISAASAISATSITWNWVDNSTTETQFIVHDGSESVITTVNSSTTAGTGTAYSYIESSLTPNTSYTRHVHATDGTFNSSASSTASAYTLANAPTAPTLSAQTTTGMVATIAVNSNPVGTQYVIHETSTNKYVQADGTLGVSAVWQTYNNWGGASGQVTSGLLVNTNYVYEVKARNADSVETAYSATAALYTLANVPGKPTLANPAGNSISITINENSNPATTTYAIYDNTDSKYVQADGTLGDGDVWQTYTNWGGVSGKSVLGLTPNTSYTMKVKARNGNNTETAFSADSDALATLVSASDAPTISNPTSSSILITINTNSNPVSAQYAIHETSTNKFVQADGTLGASAVWQTYAQWGGASGQTVSGLSINTNYTLEVKARNAENVETAYSATTTKATLSVVPTITSGEAVSTTSVKITFGTDTNPDDTSYAVYESSTTKYLQADGTLGDSISWLVKTIINSASGNIVTGLASGSTFVFSSKTKNKDGVETDYSSTVSVNTDSAITDSAIKPLPTGPMPPAVITAPSTTSTTSTTSYSPTPTPTDTTTSSSETPTPTDTSTSTSISPYPTVITTSSDGVEPCTDPGLLEQLFSNGNSYHCENGNRIDDTPPPPPPCYIFCGVDLRVHFLLPGGTYDEPTNVTIFYTPKSHAAQIRYTLDGSEPNNYSPLYTEPVYVPASVTIKAKAYGSESPTEIADFVIKQPAAGINTNENGDTPQLSITSDPAKPQLSNNLYLSPLPINITAPENTRVYYTLTGGKPVVESTSYSGSFNITKSAIVTAIAVDGDKIVATGQRQFSLATEPATVSQTTLDKIANPVGSSTLVTAGLVVSFWAGILQLILAWFQYFLRLLLLLPALLFGRKKKPNLVGKTVRGGMGEAFSFVILTLKDKYGKTIQTTLTDKSGQFGFAVKAGKYTISILKPGYGIYNNLHVGNYHGELIDVVEENNTNLTIVLDSALNTKDDGAASARWHLVLNTSRSILLVVGFLFSALIFLHAITILHAIIFAFYTLALLIPLFSLFTKYLYPLRPASN